LKSLDPRVNRLPPLADNEAAQDINGQFITFEAFVQPRRDKPFQHEGSVYAPDLELAYVLAKEAFTRRFACVSLCVVETQKVFVSPTTDDNVNIYTTIPEPTVKGGTNRSFEVFQAAKRGKQHAHAATVSATSPGHALFLAGQQGGREQRAVNIWVVETSDIRFTHAEERDYWDTLPDKQFRDPIAYKGGEKLKQMRTNSRQP
jgi:ring-1,2-phenylacetyl-CoA epoxidase subunit PaaB